uniref:Uncharacterized protein n=1 Tax=Anguilla anguilla TaxID=7936 RepID=A0A0E9P7C5_ANGAN
MTACNRTAMSIQTTHSVTLYSKCNLNSFIAQSFIF